MNESQPSSLGEQIKEAVQEGIASGDFKNLNKIVNETVDKALKEAKNYTESDQYTRQIQQMKDNWENWNRQHQKHRDVQAGEETIRARGQRSFVEKQNKYFVQKGLVGSILNKVFGGIGFGCSAITFIVFLALKLTLGIKICGGLMLLFYLMIMTGVEKGQFLKRAKRYVEVCGEKGYATIDELSQYTQYKHSRIMKDLKNMIREGVFPHGHMDQKKTYLMLSDELYRQYQNAELGRKEREAEEKPKEEAGELDQMIAEGREAVLKLREMNDSIEGEVISAKLTRLENILSEIFEKVKKYPDKMPQMHTTMSYYLPTIIKLVEAYREFDQVSVPGQDILEAKKEIEGTIDTINEAFKELLNNLFKDRVFDVTTDAQVLQTMLAKEGLAKDGLTLEGQETVSFSAPEGSGEIKLELHSGPQ